MHICNSASSVFIRSHSSKDEDIAFCSFWCHKGTAIHLLTFNLSTQTNIRVCSDSNCCPAEMPGTKKYMTFVQKSAL